MMPKSDMTALERLQLRRDEPNVQTVLDFIASIHAIPWMQRISPPADEWLLFPTLADANAAARQSLYESPWNSFFCDVWVEAWYTVLKLGNAKRSPYDSKTFWQRSDLIQTARIAARDVVVEYRKDPGLHSAGMDADLMALCLLAGLRHDNPHMQYARKRWAVWQAGYGLYTDIEGEFYVFCQYEAADQ